MGGGDRRRPAARILTEPAGLCAENTRRLSAVVALADCQPRGVRRAGGRRPGRVDISAWLVDRPGSANSNGVGFCLSQLAQFPEQSVGTSSAGEAISRVTTSSPGALPDTLEGARYPACGGPAAGD